MAKAKMIRNFLTDIILNKKTKFDCQSTEQKKQ